MRQSHTTVLERDVVWAGAFETEPYEAAWASEAIFYVRVLESGGPVETAEARVQISPDGMRWCDEGTRFRLTGDGAEVTFGRVSNFGTYLRLVGEVPEGGQMRVIVYLAMKS